MTTTERQELQDSLRLLNKSLCFELPNQGELAAYNCPLCDTELVNDLSNEALMKIRTWTIAQLVAFIALVKRSGITFYELLDRTTGCGPDAGDYVGVQNFHGMFIGIEKDGYTHS